MLGEGYRAIQSGGVYVNGSQEKRAHGIAIGELFLDGRVMVIRHGKSSFRIVEVVSDEDAGNRSDVV